MEVGREGEREGGRQGERREGERGRAPVGSQENSEGPTLTGIWVELDGFRSIPMALPFPATFVIKSQTHLDKVSLDSSP